MKDILQRILNKRGIKSAEELDPEEKAQFETWQATLTKDELTVEDLKNFIRSQVGVIEGKWADLSTTNEKKAEWIPYHVVYKLLLAAIESPRSAREGLEKNLNQLIQ